MEVADGTATRRGKINTAHYFSGNSTSSVKMFCFYTIIYIIQSILSPEPNEYENQPKFRLEVYSKDPHNYKGAL